MFVYLNNLGSKKRRSVGRKGKVGGLEPALRTGAYMDKALVMGLEKHGKAIQLMNMSLW